MSLGNLIFLFLGSAIATLLFLKLGMKLARSLDLVTPRKLGRRKSNLSRNVPLIGGFGAAGGAAVGLFLAAPVDAGDVLLGAGEITRQLYATLIAVGILWFGGLVADRMKRPATGLLLLSHLAAVIVLLQAGVRIRAMELPWGGEMPVFLATLLTAVWLFLMIQFSRFLDGIDGLLPMVALLLTLGQLRMVWQMPEPFALALGAISLGIYGIMFLATIYPARVYWGNNGSAIPGLLLGMMAIAARTKSFMTFGAIVPMLIIVLTIGYIGLRLLERSLLAVRYPRGVSSPPSGKSADPRR
jgi:UDP-N-acetylmuramyl pentapeptide phosphotransferase/UDP-N-acetylglucosamine-1-phosphate transferase